MNTATRIGLGLGVVMGSAAAAQQTVTVDFDDQPGGIPPVVTDGMFSSFATFSTTNDSVLLIFSGSGVVGGSDPNSLTAAESPSATDFDSNIFIDFPIAANNFTFDVIADNDSGDIADLVIFHSGGTDTIDVVGNGDFSDAINIDLTGFSDITRVELVDITDEFGLSIDNLVFDVPAPGAATLLGLAGIATVRRRR